MSVVFSRRRMVHIVRWPARFLADTGRREAVRRSVLKRNLSALVGTEVDHHGRGKTVEEYLAFRTRQAFSLCCELHSNGAQLDILKHDTDTFR